MATDTKQTVNLKEARKFIKDLLQRSLPEGMLFHDWEHTKQVRKSVKKLAKEFELNGSR